MPKPVDSDCAAFQTAVALLGRPWTGLLLTVLQAGPLRFSELSERSHGITDKVLSARLKELEEHDLVLRHVDPGPPVRVAYELTETGLGFREVAQAIERWGQKVVASRKPARRPARRA
jgi:DNA-binding HxlR family transcriptional regulator